MKTRLRILALGGLFFLAACSHFEKLTSLQGKSEESLTLKKVWVRSTNESSDIGYRKSVRMSPLVLSDRVIQGNGFDGLVAVDRESGNILWRIGVKGGVEGGVSVVKDHLFFGGNDGQFYSASVGTGKIYWSIPVRSETLAAPLIEDGVVYFLTGNNVLHAIDASDGHEMWIYSRVDSQSFSIRGASSPTVVEGVLMLGFSDGYLVALDAKSGSMKWETLLNKNKRFRDIDSTPVVDGEFVYVTGYDSHLYCVKFQTGELVWKSEPGGFGKVLIKGDRLFYSSSAGEVLAIDKKSGSPIWRYKLSEGIATSPMVYKNYLAIGESQGALRLLNMDTGAELGHISPGHGIFSPIAVDENKNEFYFLSNNALLYKIKAHWDKEREDLPWLL